MKSLISGLLFVCLSLFAVMPAHAALNNENNPHEHCVALGAITSTTTIYAQIVDYKQYWRVKAMQVMDPTGVTGSNTNYVLITLQNGSNVVATYDSRLTGQGTLTAGVAGPGVVNTTNQDQTPLSVLKVVVTIGGTGATNAGAELCYDHAVK